MTAQEPKSANLWKCQTCKHFEIFRGKPKCILQRDIYEAATCKYYKDRK